MRITAKLTFLACGMLLLTTQSRAAINYFYVTYYGNYFQASDATPPDSFSYGLAAAIFADSPGDLVAADITFPDLTTQPMYSTSFENKLMIYYSPLYSSIANMVLDYPAGNYFFNVTAGNAAPDSTNFNVVPDDFPAETPYLTGTSWSDLQNSTSYTDKYVTWDSFTTSGTMATQQINTYLYDYTDINAPVITDGGPNGVFTGTVFPGSSMKSGHYFAYTLSFFNLTEYPNAGFGTATGATQFIKQTTGEFYVLADPGTVAGLLTLEAYYYPTGYPIEVEVLEGENVLETVSFPLGFYGHYAADTTVGGTKSLRFKARHFLSKVIHDLDLSVGQDYKDVFLKNGDVDLDNEITLVDFGQLSAAFGSAVGDPNFNPDADLDGDQEVTLIDYGILSANFGEAGE